MLLQIRERASGWLAWVLVILISVPFALWGIQTYFENYEEVPVATVNGEDIPRYLFQNQLSQRRQAATQNGGALPPESTEMRASVVEQLIEQRLIRQYTTARNYRFPDQALRERIQTAEVFLTDGEFDPELYRNLLRANGYTVLAYENLERENAAVAQLYTGIAESAFVTEQEMTRLLTLQSQKRKSNYVILPLSRVSEKITIEDAEAEQQYQDNLSAYQQPARIKVDYIELSTDNLAGGNQVSEQEIRELYEETRERYTQAEARSASHILFSLDSDADAATREKIRATAEGVLKQAQGKADFAELAKAHSADPGSKDRGGDLGVVTRGQMVKPFEDAVFDMEHDEVRGLIETRFGYHIIKLTKLEQARQKKFEEVREDVATEAQRIHAENQFAELGETFQNLVFENPDSLDVVAEELGLEIQQSDWFSEQMGEGIATEARVREAAFSADVLDDELNSDAIELGFERMVAVRKADFQAAQTKPFAEVQADIKTELQSAQARAQLEELGEGLVSQLKQGELSWDDLLSQQEVKSETLAEQQNQVEARLYQLGSAVFTHAPPAQDGSAYGGVFLGNGDYAIYALHEVILGDLEAVEDSSRSSLETQLLARDGGGAYQSLLAQLREHADVYIDQRQIDVSTDEFQYEYLNTNANY